MDIISVQGGPKPFSHSCSTVFAFRACWSMYAFVLTRDYLFWFYLAVSTLVELINVRA